jgi:hypothetical protein
MMSIWCSDSVFLSVGRVIGCGSRFSYSWASFLAVGRSSLQGGCFSFCWAKFFAARSIPFEEGLIFECGRVPFS